jgi:Domain of unknown function (DUF222)
MFEQVPGPTKSREEANRERAEERRRAAELDADIGELCGNIAAAQARLLKSLAEFDQLAGWAVDGIKSFPQWLAWRCGIAPGAARDHIKVAERLSQLDLIRDAFEGGELSYWQVRTLCRVATTDTEKLLVQIAKGSTVSQLMTIVAKFKVALDHAELERANERHHRRGLFYFFDDDGFFYIKGRLTPEDGAVVRSALQAAADALRNERAQCEPDSGDDDGLDQTMADALVRVAQDSLAAAGASAEPYRAVIHVDVASLIDGTGERCELEHGPALAAETARRLCCDARVDTVVEKDGDILDVGYSRRTPPPRLRRALEIRDQTCCWPGCTAARHLDGHHIMYWPVGPTALSNLGLLCRRHHRLVHEGGFGLTVDDDGGMHFYRPDGTEIRRPPPPRTDGNQLIAANGQVGLTIGPETCKSGWDGWRMDTTYVADMLCLESYYAFRRDDPG